MQKTEIIKISSYAQELSSKMKLDRVKCYQASVFVMDFLRAVVCNETKLNRIVIPNIGTIRPNRVSANKFLSNPQCNPALAGQIGAYLEHSNKPSKNVESKKRIICDLHGLEYDGIASFRIPPAEAPGDIQKTGNSEARVGSGGSPVRSKGRGDNGRKSKRREKDRTNK